MKKKILFIIAILISVNCFSQNPTWQWAVGVGGNLNDQGRSIATDAVGNVYTTGVFTSPFITFGSFTLNSNGYYSCGFMVKQDNAGNFIWAKKFNSSIGVLSCNGICTDKNGFIYLTGTFQGTVTFDTTTLTASAFNFFLVKLDGSGNVIWAKQALGNRCGAGVVCTDKVGYVYITGTFEQTIILDSIVLTDGSIPGNNYSDGFVAKYDYLGNVVWAKSITGDYDEFLTDIAADSVGNVYTIGYFLAPKIRIGSVILNNSDTTLTSRDNYIAHFDVKGNLVWAKSFGDSFDDNATGICISKGEYIYATGLFRGPSTTFDGIIIPGNNTCDNTFIAKFDTSSNIIWAKGFGNQPINWGEKIIADNFNNVYVTGVFNTSLTIGSIYLTGPNTDIYVIKFDSAGNAICGQSANGTAGEIPLSISLDAFNSCFITGLFNSPTASFGGIIITNDSTPVNDIFIAKLAFPLGIDEPGNLNYYADIFPNPFATNATIRFNEEQKNATIRIIDIIGKEVRVSHFSGKQYLIEKGDMLPGLYIVQITDEKRNVINKKIIVQ